jgi:hypothetical protein
VYASEDLFESGDFLFENVYRVEDGMGNALSGAPAGTGPRPNFRPVHFAAFGAPEAQTCVTCHNIGGDDGAGDHRGPAAKPCRWATRRSKPRRPRRSCATRSRAATFAGLQSRWTAPGCG